MPNIIKYLQCAVGSQLRKELQELLAFGAFPALGGAPPTAGLVATGRVSQAHLWCKRASNVRSESLKQFRQCGSPPMFNMNDTPGVGPTKSINSDVWNSRVPVSHCGNPSGLGGTPYHPYR